MSVGTTPSMERARPLRRSGVAVARGARGLLRLCLLILVLCVILVAVITASARIGLPFLAAYKPSLESGLSDYLQSPVTIEELDARWAGTGPILRARGVQLTDPLGRHAQFDELLIDMNVPRSILAGSPVMDELILVGADLALDYDRENGIRVHGVNRDGALATATVTTPEEAAKKDDGFNAVAWLLTAARVGMLDTQLSVQLPDDTTLVLENINIRAENRGDLHQLRMDVSLPVELGEDFELGADLRFDEGQFQRAGGNFYVRAADFKATGIDQVFSAYDIAVPMLSDLSQRGTKAQLELWGELDRGKVLRVNGRTAIAQASASDPTVDSLFGDLSWRQESAGGWQFAATDVVVGRSGAEAVFDEIRMGASNSQNKRPEWVSLKTAETDLLPVINTVTALLPTALPPSAAQWLNDASPSAKIRTADFSVSLQEPAESFNVAALIDDVQWLPSGRIPGVKVKTLAVAIANGRGTLTLPEQSVEIKPVSPPTPGAPVGTEPLSLETVSWQGVVDLHDHSLMGDAVVQQGTAELSLQHQFSRNESRAMALKVDGEFAADSIVDIKPWLTQTWMPQGARNWMRGALLSGKIENGTIAIEGDVADWPYMKEAGELVTTFDVRDADIRYLSSWPDATSIDASVTLNKSRLSADVTAGSMATLPISQGTAVIENLFKPALAMNMTSSTSLNTLVEFGNTGPLKGILQPVLGGAAVTGPARMEVQLNTPLRREKLPQPVLERSDARTSRYAVSSPVVIS